MTTVQSNVAMRAPRNVPEPRTGTGGYPPHRTAFQALRDAQGPRTARYEAPESVCQLDQLNVPFTNDSGRFTARAMRSSARIATAFRMKKSLCCSAMRMLAV